MMRGGKKTISDHWPLVFTGGRGFQPRYLRGKMPLPQRFSWTPNPEPWAFTTGNSRPARSGNCRLHLPWFSVIWA